MFNSYVELPEGNYGLIIIESPFSYGFPMGFLRFPMLVYQRVGLGFLRCFHVSSLGFHQQW